MKRYNPKDIEPKWQKTWDETGVYTADLQSSKPKYIAMSMFNYPSGAGIHIGHAMNYTISDVKARFKRQQGFESYHPVGWDAFGLPAENYAIKSGVSPQESMATIIPSYHKQYKAMGWSNDWEKEIATHLPEYYKWTQWIFAQMYKHGLAYQDARMQWWCTKCQTVLANEQVIDGKCWRHDGADDPMVEKKEVKQWFFKITDYADELLDAIEGLDWTESVKLAQKNWIGKKTGIEITYNIEKKYNYVLLHGFTGSSKGNFFPWLKAKLEEKGATVAVPDLPNSDNPNADEQAEFVIKNCHFDENTILLGHSYGSVAALKVLEKIPHPIAQLVTVAGFDRPGFSDRERNFEATTNWNFDFSLIKHNVGKVIILRAANDMAVPRERADQLKGNLGGEIVDFTAQENHVCGVKEPVVLQSISPSVTVFTTRPDTNFGATFVVISPEHDLAQAIAEGTLQADDGVDRSKDVAAYAAASAAKSEVERQQEGRKKTGVFTGLYAVNGLNGRKLPIWVADFVLSGFGTGAVVGVPAHDERDYDFAKAFDLPIEYVVAPEFIDETTPPRKGVEFIERIAAQAIVKHPTDDTYLLLRLKGWDTEVYGYPTGGLDDGESPVEAATRELAEETGLHNIKHAEQVGEPYFAQFYHEYKKVNRRVKMYTVAIELKDLDQQTVAENEQAIHELQWMTAEKVAQKVHGDGCKRMFAVYLAHDMGFVSEESGVMINSEFLDGLDIHDATEKMMDHLEEKGWGKRVVNYRMRDWSVSRQRYWGAPIPIIHCGKCGTVLVPDEQLPVVLPELDDFQPSGDGRSALARAKDWLTVNCPQCGGPAERETDTLDTYICSSWYMYRYLDPRNQQQIFDSNVVNKWQPIDFYNGGDHATAHLLYARFIGHFFTKIGLINEPEPFKQFLFNGKITAQDGTMFSKSKGNGIDPLEIIEQGYGADALRTYLMFAAPLELWAKWDPQGVPGTHRFLSRIWTLVQEFTDAKDTDSAQADSKEILRVTHTMIKKMTEDIEGNRYNTAIASAMGTVNDLYKLKTNGYTPRETWQTALEALVACVAPFAPHTADELWFQLGHSTSVQRDSWPEFDEQYLVQDEITIAVQVNGKLRGEVQLPATVTQEAAIEAAKSNDKVKTHTDGKEIVKTIYVPGKIVNLVVK